MLSLEKPFREKLLPLYRTAPLDLESFHRKYKACSLTDCEGICCHGGSGFYLKEEADTITALTKTHHGFFEKNGIDISGPLFEEETDEETGVVEYSTAVHPETYTNAPRPEHFPETSCIYRRHDGACSLQVLSMEEGKHSWWYKPVACWLYPIELEWGGKPFIRVAHPSTDEYVDETYPGFVEYTPCGMECTTGGQPAYISLAREIAELSRLIDRDLLSEIMAYNPESA